jgi:hypothetical protein
VAPPLTGGFRLLYGLKTALEARGQRLELVVPAGALMRDVISITGSIRLSPFMSLWTTQPVGLRLSAI